MKKLILLLTGMICLCWFLSGCSSGNASTLTNSEGSQIPEIALSVSLKNISPTGATLVFDQYDADAPKGRLEFGSEFVIEVLKNGEWDRAPIAIEGNYGFNLIAYILPCEEITELEVEWGWLYGELKPGEYRIRKDIDDFIESGAYDSYTVYARFSLGR